MTETPDVQVRSAGPLGSRAEALVTIVAVICFLNVLPIPILDGGHLIFFSVEALRRKPLDLRTQEICQQIGLVLLVSLMFFVFYNDLVRIFTKS